MNSELAKAIYALLTFLGGRLLYTTVKAKLQKYSMLRQLKHELKHIQGQITTNRTTIEPYKDDQNSWPLLGLLDLTVHEHQLGNIFLDPVLSKAAQNFIVNCRHYNRIIKWGDAGMFSGKGSGDAKKRRTEVIQQGALLYNFPEFIFKIDTVTNQKTGTHQGHSEVYEAYLTHKIDESIRVPKWLLWPFYLLLRINGDHSDEDTNHSAT